MIVGHTFMIKNNASDTALLINIAKQTLIVFEHHKKVAEYPVSTAKNGIGSQQDSGCTPLGRHVIVQKIGDSAPINTVFVGRVPTGEIYSADFGAQYPERDWILSRILRLAGLEVGLNKGNNENGCCDTYQRYIYIHGTPDDEPMDIPLSHGCVRMRNQDIIELFEQIKQDMLVTIIAK